MDTSNFKTNLEDRDAIEIWYADILGTTYNIVIVNSESADVYKKYLGATYGMYNMKYPSIYTVSPEYFHTGDEKTNKLMFNKFLRHRIIHAFFYESGLCDTKFNDSIFNAKSWTDNEKMVDWFACQFPKITKVFNELGIME